MCNYLDCGESIADGDPNRFAAGIFASFDLLDAMQAYLRLSIDNAIASDNPLIRGLAALDRRVGQRRLVRFGLVEQNPLVLQLLVVRRGRNIIKAK
jgi:hypothetical protein